VSTLVVLVVGLLAGIVARRTGQFGALRAWRFELLLGLTTKLLAAPAIVVGGYALLTAPGWSWLLQR
jgi:hypothetical protein